MTEEQRKQAEKILKEKFVPNICCKEYFEHCLEGRCIYLNMVTEALVAMEEFAEFYCKNNIKSLLAEIKAMTEHLTQDERNEYFDLKINDSLL